MPRHETPGIGTLDNRYVLKSGSITQITTRSHNDLQDIGSLSHTTIDSYLDQAVKTTSTPVFAGGTFNGNLALTLAAQGQWFTSTNTQDSSSANFGYLNGSGSYLTLKDTGGTSDIILRTYGDSYFNGGDVAIGKTNPDTLLDVEGIVTGERFISDVAIGTSPYSCTSTTLNTNLNADLLDGYHATGLSGLIDHGTTTGLTDDDHTQYALLAGRSGGQTLKGGTASGDDLTLMSTTHATKGSILFGTSAYDEVNNRLGLGTTTPLQRLHAVYNDQFVIESNRFNLTSATPATSGGYMADGTYYYVITIIDLAGGESLQSSTEKSAVVSAGGDGSVDLVWVAQSSAKGYKIYRSTTSGDYSSPALIAQIDHSSCTSYKDISASPSAGTPPTSSTAYGINLDSASTSNIFSNIVGLTNDAQAGKSSTWVNFDCINPTRVLNYGHGITSGLYHGAYFRAYGSRATDSPTAYAGNLHFNVTLPSQSAPTGVAGSAGSIADGTYYYTYVMYDRAAWRIKSSESAGINVTAGGTGSVAVTITASPLDSANYYELYRTDVSGDYTGSHYIGRIAGDKTTFTDTIASPAAGTPAATTFSQYPRVMTWLRTEQPSGAAVKLYYDLRGNLILSPTDSAFSGATNTNTYAAKNGTAPSTVPTDYSLLYAADQAAGNCRWFMLTEGSTDPMIFGKGYIMGSNAANGDLYLDGTNNSTRTTSDVYVGSLGGRVNIGSSGNALGFFGAAVATKQTLNAYTSDGEGSAYTGIDNLQVGSVYATVADLNQLRVAYETLRASYDDLRTKLQATTLVG